MQFAHLLMALAAAAAAAGAHARSTTAAGAGHTTHPASADAPPINAEVRKIDLVQGKVTLRHGPMAHLGMPNMTMVFRVADPAMLEALQQGDKVKFTADRINGAFTVLTIKVVK